MKNTNVFDSDLNPVIEIASNEDLGILVEYLSGKFSETLTTSDAYKKHNPEHIEYADLIAKEIREMGGNSLVNVFRGEGPSYKGIVCDVADKLKAPYNKTKPIEDIENSILETILRQTLDKMTDEQKNELLKEFDDKAGLNKAGITTATLITIFKAGGFKSYQLTLIIANQIAKMILGHGLRFATNASLTRALAILTGPVGWAITGIWTAVDIAGPSYKVTIPSVIHVAMLRKKLNSITCNSCEAILPDPSIKFCPECGAKISQ